MRVRVIMAAAAWKRAALGQRAERAGQPWSGTAALDRQTLRD